MRVVRLSAFAKINLGLEVLGLRQDGYHELRTLFQTIDLHDDLVLSLRKAGIVVRCDHPLVPKGSGNIVSRAAEELARFARVGAGVEIALTKRIPVAGGLGGGSSDAAAALLGLDRLWGLGLGPSRLHPLARRLGADVPYFLMGGTVLGLGRGDEVYPLRHQLAAHVVVVDPERPVKTAAVFHHIDRSLTPRENSYTIFRFVSRDLEGEKGLSILTNDLEEATLAEAPELRETLSRIRGILVESGCSLAALSGSGSSYFGLFDGARQASLARRALRSAGFKTFASRTLSLGQYRDRLSRALGRRRT